MEDGPRSSSDSTRIYLPKPSGSSSSGITLVLPSLKALKARQNAQPPPPPLVYDVEPQEKRIPRPVKLKPLKEVLTKLINQIKKKDDYAFFLTPVDPTAVPGYADMIKHPMDLGTMTEKVRRGKYRSLEDFGADLRLVTGNAKAFNPPGSIYHTEADRIETWAIDHINKAASTVIQNEIDWTIDGEGDEGSTVNIEDDVDDQSGAPMDVDQKLNERERSVSVVSQPQPGTSSGRRGPRGPYRKNTQHTAGHTLTETLEPDGGLPGSKDGLGAFPANSAWAKTMLVLKARGKRYKTKKERLRIEKEGPPLLPDGSLDYYEVEDPFSVLSFFVPHPPCRPQLVPLYPPRFNPASQSQTTQSQPTPPASSSSSQIHHPPAPTLQPSLSSTSTASTSTSAPVPPPTSASASAPALNGTSHTQTQSHTPQPTFSHPTSLPRDYTLPVVPEIPLTYSPSTSSTSSSSNIRRRHWTIVRNHSTRQSKGKDRDDDGDGLGYGHGYGYGYAYAALAENGEPKAPAPWWQVPREPAAGDWGSFGVLEADVGKDVRKILPPEKVNPVPTSAAAQNAARLLATLVPPGAAVHRGMNGTTTTTATLWNHATWGQASDGTVPPGTYTETTEQETALQLIQQSLDPLAAVKNLPPPAAAVSHLTSTATPPSELDADAILSTSYFTPQRAAEAEAYLRDVVYGGVEGLAYVRSLAEFMNYRPDPKWYEYDTPPPKDANAETAKEDEDAKPSTQEERQPTGLGMSLTEWVEKNVVDPLTGGKHAILRETAIELRKYNLAKRRRKEDNPGTTAHTDPPSPESSLTQQIVAQIPKSLHVYPAALFALSALMQIRMQKIDMAALIKTGPEELYLSEEEWAGKGLREKKRQVLEMEKRKVEEREKLVEGLDGVDGRGEDEDDDKMDVEDSGDVQPSVDRVVACGSQGGTLTGQDETQGVKDAEPELEGPEELGLVLDYVANLIMEIERTRRERAADSEVKMKVEDVSGEDEEDPQLRNLRLNLLALAKRAPLDTIARLPKDLVPEHIRQFIPTMSTV